LVKDLLPDQIFTNLISQNNFVANRNRRSSIPTANKIDLPFFYHLWDVKRRDFIMKEGLEGVVEFLLPELAFAGEQGESTIPSWSSSLPLKAHVIWLRWPSI